MGCREPRRPPGAPVDASESDRVRCSITKLSPAGGDRAPAADGAEEWCDGVAGGGPPNAGLRCGAAQRLAGGGGLTTSPWAGSFGGNLG